MCRHTKFQIKSQTSTDRTTLHPIARLLETAKRHPAVAAESSNDVGPRNNRQQTRNTHKTAHRLQNQVKQQPLPHPPLLCSAIGGSTSKRCAFHK